MIFNKLILKNFKSHKNTVVDFNNGVNIIIGENGAGKSTILEGISFALFKQHTGKKIDDLVRNNTKQMSVELFFQHNGFDYQIIRKKQSNLKSTLYKKSGSEYIELCSGDKEVAAQINNILSMDSDLFLNAVYVRQGEIADLITKTAGEKKQLIAKLLGIDSLEKAWKDMGSYISTYEKETDLQKGSLHNFDDQLNNLETHKQQLRTMLHRRQDLDKQHSIKNELYKEHSLTLKQLDHDFEVYRKNQSEFNRITTKINDLTANQRYFEGKIKEINAAKKEVASMETDFNENLEYYEEQKKIHHEVIENENELRSLNTQLKEINQSKHHLENLCQNLNQDIQVNQPVNDLINDLKVIHDKALEDMRLFSDKQAVSTYQLSKLRASLKDLQDAGIECPICQSELNDKIKQKLEKDYTQQMSALSEEILQFDLKQNELKSWCDNITNIMDYANKISMQLNSLEKIQELINETQNIINTGKQQLNTSLKDCEEQINSILALKQDYNRLIGYISHEDEYETQLEQVNTELYQLKQEQSNMVNIEYDEEEHKRIKMLCRELSAEMHSLGNEIANIDGRYLSLLHTTKDLFHQVQELYIIKQNLTSTTQFITLLSEIRDQYSKNGAQSILRQAAKPLIEKNTKKIFNGFGFDYYDLTIDENYDIVLYGPEGQSNVNMISGGEKIAAALALRLGITQTISENSIDAILLDEPTIHLDATRKNELLDLLNDVVIPQMIIVTHDLQMENSASNLIRVTKNSGISSVR